MCSICSWLGNVNVMAGMTDRCHVNESSSYFTLFITAYRYMHITVNPSVYRHTQILWRQKNLK